MRVTDLDAIAAYLDNAADLDNEVSVDVHATAFGAQIRIEGDDLTMNHDGGQLTVAKYGAEISFQRTQIESVEYKTAPSKVLSIYIKL